MIDVSLNIAKYCNDCPYFSYETSQVSNGNGVHLIRISCEHKASCSRLVEYLDSRMKNEKGEK